MICYEVLAHMVMEAGKAQDLLWASGRPRGADDVVLVPGQD